MPPSCQPTNRCGTHIASWINGGQPSVADGQVSRTVRFLHWSARCCEFSTNIKVRNCGLTHCVYYLNGIPTCYGRYCGTDLKKKKAQREYYMSTLVLLKVAFFLSRIKNKGWRTKLR